MFAQAFPLFCIFVSWVAASPYIQSQAIINNSGECPKGVHIIGVRATTEKPGFGLMESIVDKLLSNLSGSDAYPIVYPATGITKNPLRPNLTEYIISETAGVANLTVEIKRFTEECPNNGIVLMGYSQGAHVVGDVLCGRNGNKRWKFPPLQSIDDKYKAQIKAIIQFGDPSNQIDLPWHVGTSRTPGIFARKSIENCKKQRGLWQSYCDIGDPFCAVPGRDVKVHRNYVPKYGNDTFNFIVEKVGTFQSNSLENHKTELEF